MRPSRITAHFLAALTPGLVFLLWLQWQSSSNPWGARRFTLFDDAMISMDYARTLAHHGEFTWYEGAPRIQGFTNPLWTLWMTFIHLLGLEGSRAAVAVSATSIILISLASLTVFKMLTRTDAGSRPVVPTFAAASIFFLYPTVFWSLRGMEVGAMAVFALILLVGAVSWAEAPSRPTASPVVLAMTLGTFTRFDFLALSLVTAFLMGVWAPDRLRARTFGVNCGVALAASAVVLGAQKAYWGSWLPNTYTLKMSGAPLVERLARGLVASGKFTPVLVLVGLAVWSGRRLSTRTRRTINGGSALVVTMAAYSVYIGGDAWESMMLNRFHATVLPLAVLVVSAGTGTGGTRVQRACIAASVFVPVAAVSGGLTVNPFGWSAAGIVPLVMVVSLVGVATIAVGTRFPNVLPGPALVVLLVTSAGLLPFAREVRSGNVLGTHTNLYVTETIETLDDLVDDSAVIASVWAGVPAYYTSNPMIDLLGKNDMSIARSQPHGSFYPGHNKWNYARSVGESQPDVVFQTFTRGLEPNLHERMRSWGYGNFCTDIGPFPPDGVWFMKSSTRVHWSDLTLCPANKYLATGSP